MAPIRVDLAELIKDPDYKKLSTVEKVRFLHAAAPADPDVMRLAPEQRHQFILEMTGAMKDPNFFAQEAVQGLKSIYDVTAVPLTYMAASTVIPGAGSRYGAQALSKAPTLGAMLGEAVTAGATELGAQQLGMVEQDPTMAMLSAAAPGLARGGQQTALAMMRFGGMRAPGVPEMLHREAAERVKGIAGRYAPPVDPADVQAAYGKARGFAKPQVETPTVVRAPQAEPESPWRRIRSGGYQPGVTPEWGAEGLRVPLPKTLERIRGLQFEERLAGEGLAFGGIRGTAESIAEAATPPLESVYTKQRLGMPFDEYMVKLKRIGNIIKEKGNVLGKDQRSFVMGDEEYGAWKRLERAMFEDLEDLAGSSRIGAEARQALNEARSLARRQYVNREIEDVISARKGGIKDYGDRVEVNLKGIVQSLKKEPKVQQFMGEEQFNAMIDDLLAMRKRLPTLPPEFGQSAVGSGRMLMKYAVRAGAGVGAGQAVGIPEWIAAPAGLIAGEKISESVASLVQTPQGRRVVEWVLKPRGGLIDRDGAAMLGAAARALGTEALQE